MTDSIQRFRLTRDAEGNTTLHAGARPAASGRRLLSVIGPFAIAPPTHAMPPGEFDRWVGRLERLGYAVALSPGHFGTGPGAPPGRG